MLSQIIPQSTRISYRPTAPYLTRAEKAKRMPSEGYRLSECVYAKSVYLVHKPGGGQPYRVDLRMTIPFCDCWDSRKNGGRCKHIRFVQNHLAFAATLPSVKTALLKNRVDAMIARCDAQERTLEALAVLAGELRERAEGINLNG